MKSIVCLSLIFISGSLIAQDENHSPFIKKYFPKTHAVITSESAKEWPGDYEMQAYRIKNQCNSLYEFLYKKAPNEGIPEEILKEIKDKALFEWSENKEIKTMCEDLVGLPKVDCKYSCMNPDWEIVIYTVRNQIEAYKSIN